MGRTVAFRNGFVAAPPGRRVPGTRANEPFVPRCAWWAWGKPSSSSATTVSSTLPLGREASRALLGLLVRTFGPNSPLVIGVDETLERRWGKKNVAKGTYRDPVRSAKECFVKASSLRWVCLLRFVPVPWAGRAWALPRQPQVWHLWGVHLGGHRRGRRRREHSVHFKNSSQLRAAPLSGADHVFPTGKR
jgi:DDE superfamily endonuclease